ncbi:DUF192 domain-containing protein [Streptomyces cinnamoneus]|uniref:DUF192 domain-containing protein n=1 Tax=Streptomyces cinnamoneus TaxID=53446 RepID=A0A918TYP2_STRCJ|nr:DUF192 domain-containing protein [Streptomyces cinnamoneus]GHC66831.1 hypothetical protein GCM10010507_50810 [Streptomyces cinnamoneus]
MPRWTDGEAQLRIIGGPVVPIEIAASYRARTRGLLGRDGVQGALLLTPAGSVHTFGMRFPLDVAYLSRDFVALAVRTMPPGRLGLPRVRARHVLEAEAGRMAEWGLRPGTRVEITPGGGAPGSGTPQGGLPGSGISCPDAGR